MSAPRPRPRRTNANLRPADVLLAGKQTRRSSAEVQNEKAALEAQRQLLIQKREADLEAIHKLELELQAQAQQQEDHAARPPPVPSTPTTRKAGRAPPLASTPSATTSPSLPSHMVAADADTSVSDIGPSSSQASVERKVQPGRSHRITRADVEGHGAGGTTPAQAQAGLEGAGEGAAKENTVPPRGDPTVNSAMGLKTGKKRKSEGGEEPSSAKKGKPSKPSGPTAAAFATATAAKKVTKAAQNPSLVSPSSPPAVSLALSTALPTNTLPPQGVYTQSTGAPDLNRDFEDSSSALVERPATTLNVDAPLQKTKTTGVTGSKPRTSPQNIIHLEVVNVAENSVALTGSAHTSNTQLPLPPQAGPLLTAAATAAQANGPWAMCDLEPILGSYTGSFTLIFVPRLINSVGNHSSAPWSLHGLDLKGAMERLAAEIWPMLTIVVMPRQPFYDVAKQKLSDYRNGVANEAVEVVTAYMLSKRFDTANDRTEYIAWALSREDNWPFRYERVVETEDGTINTHGAYQSTLVSRTFAYHLRRINLCSEQIRDTPCNALALATTAVECALRMWTTGSLQQPHGRSEDAKFSERLWGRTANEYLGSIIDLNEEQWEKILAKADLCACGLDEDSDNDLDDNIEYAQGLPTTGRAVLKDADVE